jgi:hypothetical protein
MHCREIDFDAPQKKAKSAAEFIRRGSANLG